MSARTFSVQTPSHLRAFSGNPDYRTNQGKAIHKGIPVCQTQCCVLCGKKSLGGKLYVLLASTCEYVTREELDEDDLGEYPIGSDCAKKLKAAGIPVFSRP